MIISDWIAVIALIVSIASIFTSFVIENKRLKRESDAKFFQDIYFGYMKVQIPIAESNISFDSSSNKLNGIKGIQKVLIALRKKSSPYRFLDKNFYDKFIKVLENVEDFYIDSLNKVQDSYRYENFQNESRNKISELYSILNKKFTNKKF
ncbi:hypothetical protein HO929_08750 [Streptococcus suis]|uniref:Uncharacterized protein n=1 Tax=Streptococcus suis TaxID=1307 RepID=A0A0Z8HTI3_STRSU|nr:hypothetical protein [Streptococcus suis]NQH32454.1 hypothetical protein [Streptococcus suis]NQH67567.1 hypothetical protein [Streptococcus suis]NQI06944.1 hypothetical protein [Streptococcus suis]NQI18236.1 hypothetical protein [Streptococcus suis]NQP01853.1 hypothetical protein [Streptococcus suis]